MEAKFVYSEENKIALVFCDVTKTDYHFTLNSTAEFSHLLRFRARKIAFTISNAYKLSGYTWYLLFQSKNSSIKGFVHLHAGVKTDETNGIVEFFTESCVMKKINEIKLMLQGKLSDEWGIREVDNSFNYDVDFKNDGTLDHKLLNKLLNFKKCTTCLYFCDSNSFPLTDTDWGDLYSRYENEKYMSLIPENR
ncbi:hypothetical protein RhiirA5_405889 [Rhizophagus irregularis]|uniref:Uncharacterized protein n=1 Tax=Rhizophagus irregularis TaxID=588596 RepID=A0A2I1DY03_9GLOM|nr:hypothetical protein RhiirA5_405889 [Rhizophagus irregularis]PKC71285.1 hypothetical protein RhiirA1_453684 [Rhizophagus irregularis]PKY14756.1 hypothetical protein RhiirB3_426832 [Rhizophagus irregularis]CAB4481483.1 unnamed protein product [Rhizophagus irregularis]CAB5383414.1 unnamed protein product [Rhizophagus irregularis]